MAWAWLAHGSGMRGGWGLAAALASIRIGIVGTTVAMRDEVGTARPHNTHAVATMLGTSRPHPVGGTDDMRQCPSVPLYYYP